MITIRDAYVAAARRAVQLNVDLLHLHCGHGYLLATFLSPLTNKRTDEYGGCLANRMRFPLEIIRAVRDVWPAERPLAVAFSASDHQKGGLEIFEAVEIAGQLHEQGVDLIHVLSGQTTIRAQPPYGRSWQAALADAIRNEAGVPVLVGGNISSADEANTILAAGRADLSMLGPEVLQSMERPDPGR